MTGAPPVLNRPALRAALSHMQIEEPGTGRRFEEILAEEQGWPLDFAERVADEYCGFLYLAATAGFEVTPSETVDQAWHLHLEWPHYQKILCGEILGRPLDHRPGTGEPDEEERYRRQYQETLALYEQVFGKPPPTDIWPHPIADEADADAEADLDASEQGQALGRRIAFGSFAGGAAAIAFGAPVIGIVLIGAALVVFLLAQPSIASARRGDSGAGGGCGGDGGGGGSSNDCASCSGASCGGGSCGGGGCGGD
jgi:hypothetical protein